MTEAVVELASELVDDCIEAALTRTAAEENTTTTAPTETREATTRRTSLSSADAGGPLVGHTASLSGSPVVGSFLLDSAPQALGVAFPHATHGHATRKAAILVEAAERRGRG